MADLPVEPDTVADRPVGGRPDDEDLPSVARLLSLTDGVVAIALTLLVLQLTVPHGVTPQNSASALATKLFGQGDEFVSYVISFYVIAQFWLAHHRVFRHVSGHHEGLAWWNFAFLFTITIMPFTSNLLGDYGSNPLAVDLFAINLLLASLATQAVGIFGGRWGLMKASATPELVRAGRIRAGTVSVVVAVSIGVAWVNTDAAKYCWLLIAAAPWIAARSRGRRRG
ncbi:MAG TPA: TMEM175 family protein [Acidimicrobiales bacterium]|jgi:uncharacterized membrane protein|nr:TMEM175 family protein [Acidimicrobiales bacterium]